MGIVSVKNSLPSVETIESDVGAHRMRPFLVSIKPYGKPFSFGRIRCAPTTCKRENTTK